MGSIRLLLGRDCDIGSATTAIVVRALKLARRGSIDVLAGTSDLWAVRVVACHVASAAATGRIVVGLQRRGDEVSRSGVGIRIIFADVTFKTVSNAILSLDEN